MTRKSFGDWATVLAFGAITWPWLLRSLSAGPIAERTALLSRLNLPEEALPNLGSWKADSSFLNLVTDQIFSLKPELVVEFGAGASTLVAARAIELTGKGRLISFDEHKDFVQATRNWVREHNLTPEIRHAPLSRNIDGWHGRWYDYWGMPEKLDLLILDGLHWGVHPLVRGAAECLFDRVRVGGVVLLDDAARPGERLVAGIWRKRWPQFEFSYARGCTKGAHVGKRMSATSFERCKY